MKLIIAYIQPYAESRVADALHHVPGLTGATFISAQGFGRGRRSNVPDSEALYGVTARTRVEIATDDTLADHVVHAIYNATHTGTRGDGKILVLSVERAVRISTGEEGDAVVVSLPPPIVNP